MDIIIIHIYILYIQVRMYVFMCECMNMCTYVFMHVFMYVCVYVCIYVCMYACMYVCMYEWCMHALYQYVKLISWRQLMDSWKAIMELKCKPLGTGGRGTAADSDGCEVLHESVVHLWCWLLTRLCCFCVGCMLSFTVS